MAILSGGLDPKISERLVQEQQALDNALSNYEKTSSVSSHSYRVECQQVIKTLAQKLLSDLRLYGHMSNTDLEHMASSITARLCKTECVRDDEMMSTRMARLLLASLDQEIGDLCPPSARLVDHTTTKSYVDEALRGFTLHKVVGKKAGVPIVEKTISHGEPLDPITRIDLRDAPGGNPDFCYELIEIKKTDGSERVLRQCDPLHRQVTSKVDEGKAAAPGWGTKILDAVSETIIPSAFAEEVPAISKHEVTFEKLWSSYTYVDMGDRPDWIDNTCAFNMSNALAKAGAPTPRGKKYETTAHEGKSVLFRVRDLDSYLKQNKIGTLTTPTRFEEIQGKRGILYFNVPDFVGATGHATLWDGSRFHPEDHFCTSLCDNTYVSDPEAHPCWSFCDDTLFERAAFVHFYEFPR